MDGKRLVDWCDDYGPVVAVTLELHETLEALSPRQWNDLERALPGDLARQLRSLTDAYLAARRRQTRRDMEAKR